MNTGRWQVKLSVLLTIFLGMGLVLIWYAMIGSGAPPAAARRWQPLAPIVQDAAPAPNALNVPATATVALTFDEPVDLTSVTSRTFAVHGSQGPRFKGAYELSNLSRTVSFDPARAFFPGERVDASVTTGTQNITGTHAPSSVVWQFWAATEGGSAHFIDSGQSITSTEYGRDSVLGDLDGDGDLDAFLLDVYSASRVWLNDGSGVFSDSGFIYGTMDMNNNNDIAMGDVDGDGLLDVVIAKSYSMIGSDNQVWRNVGGGIFTLTANFGMTNTLGVALGDVDGDGDLDAWAANASADRLWLNDGAGTFVDSGQALGNYHNGDVAFGDFDGDGDLDAFVGGRSSITSTVWMNDGRGVFQEAGSIEYPTGGDVVDVAVGDLDGDGDVDIWLSVYDGPDQIWLNDGEGVFTPSAQNASMPQTENYDTELGDFDGDGDLDAYVGNWGRDDLVWLNDGHANFTANAVLGSDTDTYGVALGDVDGDGDLDVLLSNYMMEVGDAVWLNQAAVIATDPPPNSIAASAWGPISADFSAPISQTSVTAQTFVVHAGFHGNVPGTLSAGSIEFAPDVEFAPGELLQTSVTSGVLEASGAPVAPYVWQARVGAALATGELTATGQSLDVAPTYDVAVGDLNGDTHLDAFFAISGTSTVWLNNGAGNLDDSDQELSTPWAKDVALGDLDGDGDLDAFIVQDGVEDGIWRNDGSGNFVYFTEISTDYSWKALLGDLDGDGDLDVYVINNGQPNTVWLNDGTAVFSDTGQALGNEESRGGDLGDVDGDGDLDVVAASLFQPSVIWLNDGAGHFPLTRTLGTSYTTDIALGDIDGDGDLDAFLSNEFKPTNEIWLNDGGGQFFDGGQRPASNNTARVAFGDLDGDGDLDAFGANISNQDTIWRNDGAGNFFEIPHPMPATTTRGAAFGDMDGDGALDIVFAHDAAGVANTIWRNKPIATDEVYVSALSGDDDEGQNHCADSAAPCRTVAHAIEMAEASGTVYVAQGVYTENLSIYKPLTLAGGYESAGWTRDIHTYETILDGSANQTMRGDWDGGGIHSASVISDGGMYKMWYHGRDLAYQGFGLAISNDGINWTKAADNPVYTTTEHWGHISYPFVLKDGATFKLWYAGEGAIYYGESGDGITWDVDTSAPVLARTEGTWEESGISAPFVLQLGASDYRMWYQTEDQDGIGYATSTDGITWTKHLTPVLTPGGTGVWDEDGVGDPALWFDGGAYHMWYANASNWLMGYATSTNGIDWNKYGGNPVFFTGVSGEWDDTNVAAPHVLFDQGEYRMWYAGFGGSDFKWQRGYAVSPDGVTWSKYEENPILTADNSGEWGQPVVTLDEGGEGSVIEGFTITGGDARDAGGVDVRVDGVSIRKCHFHHNTADSDNHHSTGAAIRANDTLRVEDSIFTENRTKWAGASAIRVMTLSVTNTLIADNRGDAALHFNGGGRLMNVTIADNDDGLAYNPLVTSTLRITNSVLYHNGYAIRGWNMEAVNIAYSDIEGGWPGEGNLDAAPRFVDAANHDYHLQAMSPLIDAGTATGAPGYDLDGTMRPQNSGFDIGALEFVGTPVTTRYVTTTADSGLETLRDLLAGASSGDTILFDPGVFPPTSPTTISLLSSLPIIEMGDLTIDGSDAGVIIDGSQVGSTPETLLLDAISMRVDGGPDLIVNGDFDAGTDHWRPWDDEPGAVRGINTTEPYTSPHAYSWKTVAHVGSGRTFYDTTATDAPLDGPPPPTSTVWITATGGMTVEIDFWYRYDYDSGSLTLKLWGLRPDGSRYWFGDQRFEAAREWTPGVYSVTLPADLVAFALEINFDHSDAWATGLSLVSDNNTVRGVQIVNFPHHGIAVTGSGNQIGGDQSIGAGPLGQGNLISRNGGNGVDIGGSGAMSNTVVGNHIGADASGLIAVPNANGILIREGASANRIGGLTAASENIIAYNDGDGIVVKGSESHGNALLRNRIHSNGALGIDLGGEGVTRNDKLDIDFGPNDLQNFPVLLSVVTDTVTTTIRGRLHSAPTSTFTLRFFSSPACDASGYGEGQDFLGARVVETDARGNVYFRAELANAVPDGHFVAATATDPAGNTSEFSLCAVPGIDNTSWPKAHRLQWREATTNTYRVGIEQRITRPGESRWYKFTVQPESRLIIALTDLPANYDLTVYKDIAEMYQSLTTLTDTNDLEELDAEFAPDAYSPDAYSPDAYSPDAYSPDAYSPDAYSPDVFSPDAYSPDAYSPDAYSPDAYSPDAYSPDAYSPDAYSPDAYSPDAYSPDAYSPDAYSSAQMRSLIGVSAFNGNLSEGILLNTWQNSGDFYIRVRGRGEAYDTAHPFRLNLILQSSLCHNVTDALPATSLTAAADDYKTLVLADFGRMRGADNLTLQTRLDDFVNRPEVAGVVVDVGEDARVAAANAQADAHPTCPYAKNLVAEAVKAVSDRYWDENPLEYIVIVGNDDVIPFFRHPDEAMLANESGYVPPVRDNTASQASLKLGYVLSQDRYAARINLSQKAHKLPVPELGIGRLVETPADIMRMIDAYLSTPDGVVSPSSALVTGYDFLEDVARDVQGELEKGIGAPADTLILTSTISPQDPRAWTAEDLRNLVIDNRYDIAFLAGHFSASSALAADYSTRFLSTEVVSSTVDMTNAIFYSAGCHSGYNIVDDHDVPGITLEPDWAQAFARKGATLIAGTGYQYGDTDFIEYSERLYRDFTRLLGQGNSPVPLGQALTDAKHKYMVDTANWRGIHTKSVMQATLFGLPMLRVDFPQRNAAKQPLSTSDVSQVNEVITFTTNPGLALGLAYADLTVTPPLTRHTVNLTTIDGGAAQEVAATYFSGPEGVVANPMEPALPLAIYEVGFPDMAMRGVGFRGGAYTDHEEMLALTGAPATEIRGVHGLFPTSVFYPIRPWQVNYFQALRQSESSAHLMLTPAQYWFEFDEGGGEVSGSSILRQFKAMDFRFYYSNNTTSYNGHVPALAAPPTLSQIEAVSRGDVVTFTARAYGDPAAGIQEVWVTYSAISGTLAGRWQSLNLVQDDEESMLWRGVLTLKEGASPEALRYVVQAVNGVGLVSMDTNLGEYHSLATVESETPGPPPEPPQSTLLNLTVSSPQAPYGARVTVTAQLMTTGTNTMPVPAAGQRIVFGLGSQRRYARTNANGLATLRMALLVSPGDYEIRAAFQGNSKFQGASAALPISITRQATNITLEPDSMAAIAALGADGTLTVTLTNANGGPLAETTMLFIAQGATQGRDYEAALTTDYLGRATVAAADLPAYLQSALVTFGDAVTLQDGAVIDLSDERYLPSSVMLSRDVSVIFLPVVIRQSD